MRFFAVLAVLVGSSAVGAGPYRYYSTCYYTPTYSYYQPYQYQTYQAPAYTPPYVAPAAPAEEWETAAVKFLAAQKRIDSFNKFVEAHPGFASAYAGGSSSYYGGQGSTVYAYPALSVKTQVVQENTGVNLELADQRTARLEEQRNSSSAQSSSQRMEFLEQVRQDNARERELSAREREINAKAQAVALAQQGAERLFNAANAAASSKTTTTVAASGTGVAPVVQPASVDRSAFLKSVARQDCAACHSPGPNMKGNFNIEAVGSINRAQANEILRRITSTDPAVVMPKPAAGQPAKHVSDEHMAAWVAMLSQVQ